MKLVIDERVKHRLVGLAVILSIAAIFAPAIMKKSGQRFRENMHLSVKLPQKPSMPKVVVAKEKQLFKTVKVAHVEIPAVQAHPEPMMKISKAEPLSQMKEPLKAKSVAESAAPSRVEPLAKLEPIAPEFSKPITQALMEKPKVDYVSPKKAPTLKKTSMVRKPPQPLAKQHPLIPVYEVQLATFAKPANAQALVSTLKRKGYRATVNKVVDRKVGLVYKVLVGPPKQKEKAKQLQRQLASTVQMNGFIVAKGIS